MNVLVVNCSEFMNAGNGRLSSDKSEGKPTQPAIHQADPDQAALDPHVYEIYIQKCAASLSALLSVPLRGALHRQRGSERILVVLAELGALSPFAYKAHR